MMFFNSVKEINRLISKGITNIYLIVTIGKNDRSIKSGLQDNDIEIYSTHNEGKSGIFIIVAKRFVTTLKNKIYKYMPLMSKMHILIS